MKFLIVSDTHGMTEDFIRVFYAFKDQVDYFIHCGDVGFSTLECNELEQFITVEGNCDAGNYPVVETIQKAGSKHNILITHGHLLDVKWNLNRLYYKALEQDAKVVCFGHTHQPLYNRINDVVLINPGSLFANRGVRGKTFAILTLDNDHINVTHYNAETFTPYTL
ncbi:metallophosphoesterase family protein [Haloplasma contractile]|uniref:metallophosphoesterase family protein n=1 Tax=Haloplasma contractile TaxID=471825 RepID=UPI000212118C|nr:metallophosphoesterase [Haloplasma contractile]